MAKNQIRKNRLAFKLYKLNYLLHILLYFLKQIVIEKILYHILRLWGNQC